MTHPPLLSLRQARIDREGAVVCQGINLDIDGSRVVLAGTGADAIVDAIAMLATVSHGYVLVDGHNVTTHSHLGHVGIALFEPPLPPRMTVEEYLTLSLRTLGLSRRLADASAHESLALLELSSMARCPLRSLAIPERRVLSLAASMIPESKTVVASTPLRGLEGPDNEYVLSVLGRLSTHRRMLVSASQANGTWAEQNLFIGATHVAILAHDALLWSGPAAELMNGAPKYALHIAPSPSTMAQISDHASNTVHSEHDFIAALEDAGFAPQGRPPWITVSLDNNARTTDILSIASKTGVIIQELIPTVPPLAPRQTPQKPPPSDIEPALNTNAPTVDSTTPPSTEHDAETPSDE